MRRVEPRAEEVALVDPAAPVIGFRIWRGGPTGDAPCLHSPHRPLRWRPGEAFHGSCLPWLGGVPPTHPAPARGCTCGVYGVGSPQALERYLASFEEKPEVYGREAFFVAGAALGWGRVVVGPGGWRAEWSRPGLLLGWPLRCAPKIHDGAVDWIAAAGERYAVPVVLDWPADPADWPAWTQAPQAPA